MACLSWECYSERSTVFETNPVSHCADNDCDHIARSAANHDNHQLGLCSIGKLEEKRRVVARVQSRRCLVQERLLQRSASARKRRDDITRGFRHRPPVRDNVIIGTLVRYLAHHLRVIGDSRRGAPPVSYYCIFQVGLFHARDSSPPSSLFLRQRPLRSEHCHSTRTQSFTASQQWLLPPLSFDLVLDGPPTSRSSLKQKTCFITFRTIVI